MIRETNSKKMSALGGIKIIEFSQMPITSFASMILGDFGAEVIRIDAPPSVMGIRGSTPPLDKRDLRKAVHYASNRNKKSLTIDMKSGEGLRVFLQLAKQADVLLEGFRPGVMKRLGVEYETVSQLNPGIVYCSITGYGQTGPYKDLPGHDVNYISLAGALGLIRDSHGKPVIPLNLLADWAGGALHATIGILLALAARRNTGRGQYVDISMMDGVLSLLTPIARNYLCTDKAAERSAARLRGAYPYYAVYETKDKEYISIGCIEPWLWENLCRELGRDDFSHYETSADYAAKSPPESKEWQEVRAFLKDTFRTKTREQWFELLSRKNIPVGKVYHLNEVFSDPHVKHRRMVVELEHPEVGKVRQVGVAIKLSDTPGEIRSLPPLLGENTDEILSGLGYTDDAIQRLRQQGIIL